jgi:hypothetical protein
LSGLRPGLPFRSFIRVGLALRPDRPAVPLNVYPTPSIFRENVFGTARSPDKPKDLNF